ncbi:MAG: hypothetical protein IJX80_04160 [Clostridia bacterium]|nr:hypothetical protein [Clostridia bacterium]
MNNESGFGANGAPYEYAVAEAKTKRLMLKKLLFIAAYILWGATVLIVGVITKLILPLLCFIPLSIWIIVFLTWRYTQVEYEYSYFSGKLTVSKILGGRTRKKLCEVMLRDLSAVFPYSDANLSRTQAFHAEKTVFAASDAASANLYIALWQDTDSSKHMILFFEPNEKAVKIIKYYNMSAIAK